MDKIKSFIMTSLLGGIMVILPVAILLVVFGWVFQLTTDMIQPLTDLIVANSDLKEILADAIVLAVILAVCFLVGLAVRTRLGKFIFHTIEDRILKVAPGYNLIKETVLQILGSQKSPFSSVALSQVFGSDTLVTSFVTDEHPDGSFTVFVPTGPNPTSGYIFHLPASKVHKVDVPVESAMRSVISCGAGSTSLIEAFRPKS